MASTFVGNRYSSIVHADFSECVDKMHPENAVFFEELYHALGDGYQECGHCLGLWGSEQMAEFSKVRRAARERHFGECLVCGESRGVQRAHIVARADGGVDCMPMCPNHHWNYDHGLLTPDELAAVVAWVGKHHNAKFARWIEGQYLTRRASA